MQCVLLVLIIALLLQVSDQSAVRKEGPLFLCAGPETLNVTSAVNGSLLGTSSHAAVSVCSWRIQCPNLLPNISFSVSCPSGEHGSEVSFSSLQTNTTSMGTTMRSRATSVIVASAPTSAFVANAIEENGGVVIEWNSSTSHRADSLSSSSSYVFISFECTAADSDAQFKERDEGLDKNSNATILLLASKEAQYLYGGWRLYEGSYAVHGVVYKMSQWVYDIVCPSDNSSIFVVFKKAELAHSVGLNLQVFDLYDRRTYEHLLRKSVSNRRSDYVIAPSSNVTVAPLASYATSSAEAKKSHLELVFACLPPQISTILPADVEEVLFFESPMFLRPKAPARSSTLYLVGCSAEGNSPQTWFRMFSRSSILDNSTVDLFSADSGLSILLTPGYEERKYALYFFVHVRTGNESINGTQLSFEFRCSYTSSKTSENKLVYNILFYTAVFGTVIFLAITFFFCLQYQLRVEPDTAAAAERQPQQRIAVRAEHPRFEEDLEEEEEQEEDEGVEVQLSVRQLTALSVMSTATDTSQTVCCICITHRPTHICVPCGHLVLCGECAVGYRPKSCPICRTDCRKIVYVTFFPMEEDVAGEQVGQEAVDATLEGATTMESVELGTGPQESVEEIGASASAVMEGTSSEADRKKRLPKCLQCSSNSALCAPVPCGHVCLCESCHPECCPVCERRCRSIVRVFR